MKINKSLILLFYSCFFIQIEAQISTNEEPVSFAMGQQRLSYKTIKTLNEAKTFDFNKINKEDIYDEENGIPPRFGIPIKVDLNLNNSGVWSVLENGDKIWQLNISSHNALSLNLLYDKFWLPDGAKFFVYSQDKEIVLGAFTSVKAVKRILKGLQQV